MARLNVTARNRTVTAEGGPAVPNLSPEKLARVKDEVGDVLNYLIRLCSKLDINLIEAANHKIGINEIKYPVEKSKGNAKKYTELAD